MLQKVIVVLVGLVMSLVGALTPEGLFASPTDAAFGPASTVATEQTLATVRAADGLAFAKVPVLWLEVDGKRVAEDAWGTGEVKELRFKVGVKDVEAAQLAVGDKLVPLKPTDVITVRTFHGDFAYRGMGTANAAVQLQGTVKTTSLHEGAATGKLRTEVPSDPTLEQDRIAYVVLDTGKELDTVARESGGARVFTEEGAAANAPGNVFAKWVKVDGKLVREYTWGDGQVGRIEFEPADSASRAIVSFGGAAQDAPAGARVVVKEFVGEYLVVQAQGGLLRLKLDGYAEDVTTGAEALAPLPSGPGAPRVAFDVGPDAPRTTDVLTFRDRSADDGVVVFWRWDFGDGIVSALQDPTHRYTKPGAYNVTLNVTDEDLHTSETSRIVVVRNADPVADFEWLPRIVTTDSLVAFSDLSLDADGVVANYSWDFGDGTRAYTRSPTHQFSRSGALTVALTVTDDLGGRATITKQVLIRNHPPVASFEWSPLDAPARTPMTFASLSTDRDGRVVSWAWDLDGKPGVDATGATVAYTFRTPGAHLVTLTVTDDGGATDTVSAAVQVPNTPPTADFDWDLREVPTVQAPLHFFNRAADTDGVVVLSEWNWGDGSSTKLVTQDPQRDVSNAQKNAQYDISVPPPAPDAEHQYARPGTYEVQLCATDNFGAQTCKTRTVAIEQSAPLADIHLSPTGPHYRNQLITFTTSGSRDPDGDPIVFRLLEFGDGTSTTNVTEAHTYSALGAYPVKLTVRDSTGREGRASMTVLVVNRPPSARIAISDDTPAAGQPLTFTAIDVEDLDGPTSAVTYAWTFQPSGEPGNTQSVTRSFRDPGAIQVTLVVRDADGGVSSQITRAFDLALSSPNAVFSVSDDTPNVGDTVTFTDGSSSWNGPITSRQWTIGGQAVSQAQTFDWTFASRGPVDVTLTVSDGRSTPAQVTRTLVVNAPPRALLSVSPDGQYAVDQTLTFHDASTDLDGAADILTRSWDFGDGTVIADTDSVDLTHAYAREGTYHVVLTIADEQATSTADLTIRVVGRSPIGKWHVVESGPWVIGQTLTFVSDSYDPDGNPIVSHAWSWGDGGTTTTPDASTTHAFARSGLYRVQLRVSDGQQQSALSGESVKSLRVWADHPVTLDVSALLPHDALQDLRSSNVALTVQHSPTLGAFRVYTKAELSGGPEHLTLTFPAGGWAEGDRVEVNLQDLRYMTGPTRFNLTLDDDDGLAGPIPVQFTLPLPLRPSVRAMAETSQPVIDSDETVYDTSEPFHGAGQVVFLDGVPASGATVTVQLRYLPLDPARDSLGGDSPVNGNTVLGWCTVDETLTQADGTFTWRVTQDDGCALDERVLDQSGARALGTWQVRAIARKSFAAAGTSQASTFHVDPTGALGGGVLP